MYSLQIQCSLANLETKHKSITNIRIFFLIFMFRFIEICQRWSVQIIGDN